MKNEKNEMREQINKVKNFGTFLKENAVLKEIAVTMAHKYSLKVKWNKRTEWDMDINLLAINSRAVTMEIPFEQTEEDYIVYINVQLLERNVEKVNSNFSVKRID